MVFEKYQFRIKRSLQNLDILIINHNIINLKMDITRQDLKNTGIDDLIIDTIGQFLKKILQSDGQMAELYAIIQASDRIVDSQKMILKEYIKQEYCKHKNISQSQYDKELAKSIAKGGILGTLTSLGAGYGISALGFSSSGVVGGSIAAGIQSSLGVVQAGSLFASLQSLGATGALLNPVTAVIAGGIGATAGLGYYCFKKFGKKQEEKEEKEAKDK